MLCLIWMSIIYMMSAMPGDVSGAQSGSITELILSVISCFAAEGAQRISPDTIETIVRKGAHMAEYAILFLLYRRALILSGAKRPGITALCMCAGYAATDEMHQGFVDGRGPSMIDVMIDTAGACVACCGAWLKEKL